MGSVLFSVVQRLPSAPFFSIRPLIRKRTRPVHGRDVQTCQDRRLSTLCHVFHSPLFTAAASSFLCALLPVVLQFSHSIWACRRSAPRFSDTCNERQPSSTLACAAKGMSHGHYYDSFLACDPRTRDFPRTYHDGRPSDTLTYASEATLGLCCLPSMLNTAHHPYGEPPPPTCHELDSLGFLLRLITDAARWVIGALPHVYGVNYLRHTCKLNAPHSIPTYDLKPCTTIAHAILVTIIALFCPESTSVPWAASARCIRLCAHSIGCDDFFSPNNLFPAAHRNAVSHNSLLSTSYQQRPSTSDTLLFMLRDGRHHTL